MADSKFITHNGKEIYHIDFTSASIDEVKLALPKAKADISSKAEGSVLTMTDVSGTKVSTELSNLMKEFVSHNKPYVKAGTVIGVQGILKITFNAVLLFSGRRNLHLFDTQEEAKNWLVQQ